MEYPMPPPTRLAQNRTTPLWTEEIASGSTTSPCQEVSHEASPDSDDELPQEDLPVKKKYVSDSPSEVLRKGATTLVLQNLPRQLRQSSLLKAIDDTLRPGLYNFCYMPMCFKTQECVGHAFINFLSSEVAAALVLAWDGSTALWMNKGPVKPLVLQASKYQGLDDLLALSCMKKAHRIRNEDFRPYFAPGVGQIAQAGGAQPTPEFRVTVSL